MARQPTFDIYQVLLKRLRNITVPPVNCQAGQSASDALRVALHRAAEYVAGRSVPVSLTACANSSHKSSSHQYFLCKNKDVDIL